MPRLRLCLHAPGALFCWRLTQEALARQTNLHVTQISSLERGHRNPTYRALRRISRGLDMKLSQLIALAEELEGQRSH